MKITAYRLEEGERIPRGYGIAYYDVLTDSIVCYPIPLNVVVNVCKKLYYRIVSLSLDEKDKLQMINYRRGFNDGIEHYRKFVQKTYEEYMRERYES